MDRLRLYSAPLLLAVLAAGGVLAPSVHRVDHAQETTRYRADHVAAATHHHHAVGDAHGTEVVAPCPEPMAIDWTCVLCHGVSVHLPVVATALLLPSRSARHETAASVRVTAAASGPRSIRGPPVQAA
ncbi:MAG: hypothetical protein HKN04_12095 [Rhodothermaceae bacterium]|nr:hypothetical protein [Rhodothermaceae bacterium]